MRGSELRFPFAWTAISCVLLCFRTDLLADQDVLSAGTSADGADLMSMAGWSVPRQDAASSSLTELFHSHRAGQNSRRPNGNGSNDQPVQIAEPLLFDLVRPLGARQGELEFNTLALFPWRISNRDRETDPFGSGPATFDRKEIEWAPEVELALWDNFAVEFEFPFEGSVLEEYKLGLQWTIGTAFENRYIHGFQVLVEPSTEWERWNSTLLYLGGIRFDETWSTLFMLGGRMDLEGPRNSDTFETLVNASLFCDLTEWLVAGLETNYASGIDGASNFILVPQLHVDFTENLQLQMGVGLGVGTQGNEQSAIICAIYSR